MSLSIKDAQVFKNALKAARAKKRLTQATCAELLGHSLSFQKDLERCRNKGQKQPCLHPHHDFPVNWIAEQ